MRDLSTLPTSELEALRDNWMAVMEHLVTPTVGPAWAMTPGGRIATSTTQSLARRRVTEITRILAARARLERNELKLPTAKARGISG